MTQKQQQKLGAIFSNYMNGNRKDAARQVRALKKLDLVALLTRWHETPEGNAVMLGNRGAQIDFEWFVERALENSCL